MALPKSNPSRAAASAMLLVGVVIAAAVVPAPLANAAGFVMPGTTYSARFPAEPACDVRVVSADLRALDQHVCALYDNKLGGGYALEVFPLPVDGRVLAPGLLLRAMVHGAASATRSKVIREIDTRVDGFPALQADLLDRERGVLARLVYVLEHDRVIGVTVDGGSRIHDADASDAFLKSLRLLPVRPEDD